MATLDVTRGNFANRLALRLALATALLVGATLGVGLYLLGQQRERMAELELQRATRALQLAAAEEARQLERDADQLLQRIRGDVDLLRQLLIGERVDPDSLDELARLWRLEFLDVSRDGTLLASYHWPERVGLPVTEWPQTVRLDAVQTASEILDGWILSRTLEIGDKQLRLLVGRQLDRDWLDRATSLADAAWWVPHGSREPAASNAAALLERPPGRSLLADMRPGTGRREAEWLLQSVVLQPIPEAASGYVVLGRSERIRAHSGPPLELAWGALTLVAALAAALVGRVVGRRVARPVDQLVRAVDAVAAGEQDYGFSGLPQDEFEALASSFSGLKRSLDQQQQKTAAAERVAAWQEVARHVAHEVKNPLVPIRLTIQNLQKARQTRPEIFERMFEEGASTILEEVDQLSRLVGEFSEFARLPLPQCRRHSIAKILTESLDLFESTEMTIIREIDDDLYPVDVDAQQIAQVIKNIVGNATEASAGVAASTLTVRAFNHRESVELRFTDNGPGFPDGAEHRVFEPYFTTKETGTGLGMAISYRILSDHGGEIQAESEPQGGARITMRLPKA